MKIYDDKEVDKFQAAAKPLVDWLRANGCPHDAVTVTQTSAEMLSGVMTSAFYEGDPKYYARRVK
jgi:hypothetical protein